MCFLGIQAAIDLYEEAVEIGVFNNFTRDDLARYIQQRPIHIT